MSEYTGVAARLENAAINMSPDEIRELCPKLGYVDFSAKALGLACRFRGVEVVKALAESSADFSVPEDAASEEKYGIYGGAKYKNYSSNFSLYLLNIFKKIPGACCCKGLKFQKYAPREQGKKLNMISDEERAEVLDYLCENADRVLFKPSELLLFAIITRDDFIYNELKSRGVKLSKKRVDTMVNGGPPSDMYWFEYTSLTGKLSNEDYLPVMERLFSELDGKQFHCTNKIFESAKKRFGLSGVGEFFFKAFETDRLNKTELVRGMIDENAANMLPFAEKAGWLANNKRRDELTEYAQQKKQTECTAWLLDFKNRTADLAAEQAKAEKKLNAELNAKPDSVMMMKKTWSFKKCADNKELMLLDGIGGIEDGLVITSYKGRQTEVTVPETIGKGTVRAIGVGAFSANSGACGGIVRSSASYEGQNDRRKIRKIKLPETVKVIMASAFAEMPALEEINIPDGVEIIDICAFYYDYNLKAIGLPTSLKRIMMYAFARCGELNELVIPEGVEYIGVGAFHDCVSLKKLVLPRSLKRIDNSAEGYKYFNGILTDNCPKCVVYCPKGSYAEKYCKKNNIKFIGE